MRSHGSSVGFVFSVLYVASSIASHCVVVFGSLMSAQRVCFISFEPLRNRYCIGTGQTHRQTGRQEHTCTDEILDIIVSEASRSNSWYWWSWTCEHIVPCRVNGKWMRMRRCSVAHCVCKSDWNHQMSWVCILLIQFIFSIRLLKQVTWDGG